VLLTQNMRWKERDPWGSSSSSYAATSEHSENKLMGVKRTLFVRRKWIWEYSNATALL